MTFDFDKKCVNTKCRKKVFDGCITNLFCEDHCECDANRFEATSHRRTEGKINSIQDHGKTHNRRKEALGNPRPENR